MAVGSTTRGFAKCRIATTSTQTTGTTVLGYALPCRLRGIRLTSYAQARKNQSKAEILSLGRAEPPEAHAMPRYKTMRIQIFTRLIHNGDVELEALNKFLVSHRVTDVHKAFIVM